MNRRWALHGALAALMFLGCEPIDRGASEFEARGGNGHGRGPRRDAGTPPPELDASSPADAGSPDAGTPACCGQRSLGSLPAELDGLTWPALPAIASELHVSTDSELRDALWLFSNVRIHVHGAHDGLYEVRRSDIELVLDEDAFIEHLLIARSQHRVRVVGGSFASIEMMPPIDYSNGGTRPHESLMATDLTIECVTVRAPDTAFLVRGHRVAIVGADVWAERYSLYAGDAAPIPIEDVIVAHSTLRSAGPEATYRVYGVRRSVVAYTSLSNRLKHNWRVHGVSELNYIGDSVLAGTGVMIGWIDGDAIDRAWFVRNTVHYDATNGMFLASPDRVVSLTVEDNVFYTDGGFDLGSGRDWSVARNTVLPYEPAPTSAFTCR